MRDKRQSESGSATRVLNTVLLDAIAAGALGLRFEFKGDPEPLRDTFRGRAENVVISHYIGDEWKIQSKTADCGYADLLTEIRRRATINETEKAGWFTLDLYGESGELHLVCRITIEISADDAVTLYLVTTPQAS